MRFGPLPVDRAVGHILAHNVSDGAGQRLLRKGRELSREDLAALSALGIDTVFVAQLDPGDVGEDEAAARLASALAGPGLRLSAARTGRVNLYAEQIGVLRLDPDRLRALNGCRGVALATLPRATALRAGRMVATLKVIPYALPQEVVARALGVAATPGPLLALSPIRPTAVALVLGGSRAARERITRGYVDSLGPRLEALGCTLGEVTFIALDEGLAELRLAGAIEERASRRTGLVILAGETAIMDADDLAPRAIVRAGGQVACYGAPVDPGNLLLLAYRGEVPILGAPGCAKSAKRNIVDLVLPRLLAGERLGEEDIVELGEGGLLEDVPERPLPRSRIG